VDETHEMVKKREKISESYWVVFGGRQPRYSTERFGIECCRQMIRLRPGTLCEDVILKEAVLALVSEGEYTRLTMIKT
jgi:hypothetical protein